LGKLFNSR